VAEAAAAAAAQATKEVNAGAAAQTAAASTADGGGHGSLGILGLGSGSAGEIERMLRGRLQGSGYYGASEIARLAASLPMAQGIAVVLTFLQDPEEGLPEACVTAALYQAFGMSAEATATGILAESARVLVRPDAATEAPRRPGLGDSASVEAESEDAARLEYQRRHPGLGPPLDPNFLVHVLDSVPAVALNQLQDIGKHQLWPALSVGDTRALADAVKAAWGSGKYGRLSLADRNALDAVTEISEFGVGRLAEILATTAISK